MATSRYTTQTPPPFLSHYTTLAGFIAIVQNNVLWSSNVAFLNDSKEIQHGLDAAIAVIDTVQSAHSAQIRRLAQQVKKKLVEGLIPDTYALCLCERDDLLSQWRGYGGAEQGVAINFHTLHLKQRLLLAEQAQLFKVRYTNISTQEKMQAEMARVLQELDATVSQAMTALHRQEALTKAICQLLPVFKHLGFQEEREWRFVTQHLEDQAILYRAKGPLIVPYIELWRGIDAPLPISSVTVGPGRSMEATIRSVENFLTANGYDDVTVKPSSVPYRS